MTAIEYVRLIFSGFLDFMSIDLGGVSFLWAIFWVFAFITLWRLL